MCSKFPIPPLAKYKYHRHQLVFKKLIREDDVGEYYCDVCEEERNPEHEVYYCEKCTYWMCAQWGMTLN